MGLKSLFLLFIFTGNETKQLFVLAANTVPWCTTIGDFADIFAIEHFINNIQKGSSSPSKFRICQNLIFLKLIMI